MRVVSGARESTGLCLERMAPKIGVFTAEPLMECLVHYTDLKVVKQVLREAGALCPG